MKRRQPWIGGELGALPPREEITASEWADKYRVIPRGTSPEHGAWRTSRTPYLREPLDAISDPKVERVLCMFASQIGKTDGLLLNAIGYFATQDPCGILLVQPTEIAAQSFAKERLEPMFRDSPTLRGKLSASKRDKDNTILLKRFPGGYLALAWATSAVALASRPIRVLLLDEVDRYVESTGRDGDPVEQALQRTANFFNRKIVAVSTPNYEGSAMCRLYADSDQRRLWVPCPRCGVYQVLEWAGVIYKDEAGGLAIDDTYYRCGACAGRVEERHREEMLAACEWRPDNPGHAHRGYQLSALYSPWVRWRELAAQWAKVNADRDKRGMKEFVNLRLGEPWVEGGSQIGAEQLEGHRAEYAVEVPDGVRILTAGVDVQGNRLEAEIVGWGAGRESWGIEYAIIVGDTATDAPWQQLDAYLARPRYRADGSGLILAASCVDTGHRTQEVYEWCRGRIARNVFAIKGRAGALPVIGKPTLAGQHRTPLYTVGTDTTKEALLSRLGLETPGPGYCHFPRAVERGYDAEYFRGLCSERRVSKVRAGRSYFVWEQRYARNEPLDCRVYATAAMELLATTNPAILDPQRAPPPAPPQGRRIIATGTDEAPASRPQPQGIVVKQNLPQPAPSPPTRRILNRGVE